MKLTARNIVLVVLFALIAIGFGVFSMSAKKARANAPIQKVVVDVQNPKYKFVEQQTIESLFEGEIDSTHQVIAKNIDLKVVENKVKENPYVDNCEAFINNKNQLCFTIQQKEPVFRVFNNSSVDYYVDKNGIKFPKSANFTANVPIVTGNLHYKVDSLGVQKSKAVNDVLKFFHYVKQNETANALITTVKVERNGDITFIPRMGKHTVVVGEPELLEEKFNRLFTFYKEGLSRVGWDKYSTVNLKYNHQVIAKKGL